MSALAGVAVPGSLDPAQALAARYSRVDGTNAVGLTTALRLQTRAGVSQPWIDLLTLSNVFQAIAVAVSELQIIGVVDGADSEVRVQLFGRV